MLVANINNTVKYCAMRFCYVSNNISLMIQNRRKRRKLELYFIIYLIIVLILAKRYAERMCNAVRWFCDCCAKFCWNSSGYMRRSAQGSGPTIRVAVRVRPPLDKGSQELGAICDSSGNVNIRNKTFTYPYAVVTGSDKFCV